MFTSSVCLVKKIVLSECVEEINLFGYKSTWKMCLWLTLRAYGNFINPICGVVNRFRMYVHVCTFIISDCLVHLTYYQFFL